MTKEDITPWAARRGGFSYINYSKSLNNTTFVELMGTVVKPSKKDISSWKVRYWIVFYKPEYNTIFKTKNVTYDLCTAMNTADNIISKICKLQAFL